MFGGGPGGFLVEWDGSSTPGEAGVGNNYPTTASVATTTEAHAQKFTSSIHNGAVSWALKKNQVAELTPDQISLLTTEQISFWDSNDLRSLQPYQIAAMSAAQIAAMSATQIASLSAEQLANLSMEQINGLSPQQILALGNNELSGNFDLEATSSNAMYAELVSLGKASASSKQVVFDVFLDPSLKSKAAIGTGYESVGFTLNYPATDITSTTVKVDMAASKSSPITNLKTPGKIVARWFDSVSTTDFTKPIARVTVDQIGSYGVFKDKLDITFSSVDVDGLDLTDGTTSTRTIDESLLSDRWDVKQKLVNGLDATTPIGGVLVGYYGNPTVSSPQLMLKYASLNDATGPPGTLTLVDPNKTLGIDVVSGVAAVTTAKFAIELPSNGSNARFTLSPAALAAGLKFATGAGVVQGLQGHTYVVQLDGGNVVGLAKDATLGTLTLDLNNGKDKTHEFVFKGTGSLNGAAATAQGVYVGYTATEAQTSNTLTGLTKGEWRAPDMPKGTFNKFFVDTLASSAAKFITSADALQILKLSAGSGLDWKTGTIPEGAFAAADIDGSGKISAADALIALKYASGILPAADPVKWKFYDSTTANLNLESARMTASLKTGMTVAGGADVDITPTNTFKDYFVQAILVGNVTNPALDI